MCFCVLSPERAERFVSEQLCGGQQRWEPFHHGPAGSGEDRDRPSVWSGAILMLPVIYFYFMLLYFLPYLYFFNFKYSFRFFFSNIFIWTSWLQFELLELILIWILFHCQCFDYVHAGCLYFILKYCFFFYALFILLEVNVYSFCL